RVVVGADADPSDIGMDVVDPIRDRAPQPGIDEVVNVDELGLALGVPLATVVLEISDQFLALGVDRDDRLISAEEVDRLVIDVTKLCVAIDVSTAFPRLAVCLQAVVHLAEQIAHNGGADLVPLLRQLPDEITQAPAGPQEAARIGSPRVVGSTRALRSFNRVGSLDVFFFRPPPGLRTRPSAAATLLRMSEIP